MTVTPVKTKKVQAHDDLYKIITDSIDSIAEGSVLAITSKIVALCEGAVSPLHEDKHAAAKADADAWTEAELEGFDLLLTIKDGTLIPNAGIDESNSAGMRVHWPKNPQASAEMIWHWLRESYNVDHVGVILTDSTVPPLKRGTVGICIGYCGFAAVKQYVGEDDLFGREMTITQANTKDGLAASAVFAMGEGAEQTPIALLTDVPHVEFKTTEPSEEEKTYVTIEKENDLYQKLLQAIEWNQKEKET